MPTYSMFAMNKKNAKITFLLVLLIFTGLYYIFEEELKTDPNLKYILLWTSEKTEPLMYVGLGQQGFIKRKCSHTNCYVIAARRYFGDYRKFHAVLFGMRETMYLPVRKFPIYRSPEQKYVFISIESSHNYPICSSRFDGFFNWTWTYRLDSDVKWEYIAIRDEHNRVIGPKINMHWMKLEDMRPVSDALKKRLMMKTKAAAWFVSNCVAMSGREKYVKTLQKELAKFNHTIDIFGACGNLTCPPKEQMCFDKIKDDYHFYLSFENSYSEDYVTEKLLHALQNYAIPIVYGMANYTRFMPDGIYLHAKMLNPRKLAKTMIYLIQNPDKYAEYFKWKNHYTYHYSSESEETDEVCALCKILNDEKTFRQKSIVRNFTKWWNSPDYCTSHKTKSIIVHIQNVTDNYNKTHDQSNISTRSSLTSQV